MRFYEKRRKNRKHAFQGWFPPIQTMVFIDVTEQGKRLEERRKDPLKQWKMSTVDMQEQMKWDEYTAYKSMTFANTSWTGAPWIVMKGNGKAHLEAMKQLLNNLRYPEK